MELTKQQKIARLEPFPTMKAEKVVALDFVSTEDKLKKLYYTEWVLSLTEAQKVFWNEQQLNNNFKAYINEKQIINDETNEV